MPILRVAIPSPLRQYFDYLPPPGMDESAVAGLEPGCRVLVPFGQRTVCGILIETGGKTAIERDKLRAFASITVDDAMQNRLDLPRILTLSAFFRLAYRF